MSEDGHTLGNALGAYLRSQGHEEALLLGAVCACWDKVVGDEVAAHATPRALRGGELVVSVDHAGWATQLAFLSDQILSGLEGQVGAPVARALKVTVQGRAGLE